MSRDPGTLLRRAIERSADRAGISLAIAATEQTRWASATFAGARHELVLESSAGPGFDRWLAALPEAELLLPGHLVADLKLVSTSRSDQHVRATVEGLTVEEC